jgi:hypothetical protein
VAWPSAFVRFTKAFGTIANMDLTSVSTGCVLEVNFVDKFLTAVLTPIALGLPLAAAFMVFGTIFKLSRSPRADKDGKINPVLRMRNLCLKLIVFMLFLIYPSTSNTILKMFSCRALENGKSYLSADYSIECGAAPVATLLFGGEHAFATYQSWAGFAVLAFPIGVPVFFFLLLWLHRGDLFEEGSDQPKAELEDELGFLYAGYRKQYWWWECVELFRKLALTGILAFFKPGTPEQLFLGIVLANVFIVGYAREKPYLEFGASDLQLACQQQVFFVSLSAFAVLTTAGRNSGANPAFTSSAFGIVLLLMGIAPVVVAVLQMFFGKVEAPQWPTKEKKTDTRALVPSMKIIV